MTLTVVRISSVMALKEDFIFHDKKAIVLIDQNIKGAGKKVSIVARNVIMSPTASLDVSELKVETERASLLLNVKAEKVDLNTGGDAILGNSKITSAKVTAKRDATVFGLNEPTPVSFENHLPAIASILEDAFPGKALPLDSNRFLSGAF